jgi:hypothetical protein
LTFTVSGTDSDYTGNVVKVGGVDIAAGSFTADSHVQWVDDASTAPSVVWSDPLNTSVTGKRYHLTGSTALTSPVTSVQTSTGTYQKQYQVTFGQTGIGGDTGTNQVLAVTVNGTATPYDASHLTTPSTWYDAGTALAWTYSSPVASTTAGKQYVLDTAVSPNPNPLGPIASLDAPVSVSATYKTQYQVIFAESGLDADAGTLQVLSLSINGGGPTSYNRTNLPSEWYDAGSNLNYTYSSPITVNAGEQFVLTSPSPNPSPAGPISNLSAATTVTGTYQKQWKLTFTVAGTNGDYTGTVVTVGGTPVLAGSFTSNSYTQWVNHNSPAPSVTWNDPLTSSVTGKRYRLTGSTSLTSPVTAPQTSEGTYQKQWLLTFTVKGTAATDGDYSGTW